MARYEDSPADRADDKRMARKRGMSLKEWEASPEDAERDAKKQAELDGKGDEGGHGIEKGSFQTSGNDGDLEQDEMKSQGRGMGSAMSGDGGRSSKSIPNHHFAHQRPVT